MLKAIIRPRNHYWRGNFTIANCEMAKCGWKARVGSGDGKKQVNGKEAYSAVHIFKDVAEFRLSLNPEYGHGVMILRIWTSTAA
jgi:hypothetical protein